MIRKFFRFFAEYFVLFVGILFIFVIGAIYAFLRPQGGLINGVFLVILVGWVIYQIKYFWDFFDKKKKEEEKNVKVDIVGENDEESSEKKDTGQTKNNQ